MSLVDHEERPLLRAIEKLIKQQIPAENPRRRRRDDGDRGEAPAAPPAARWPPQQQPRRDNRAIPRASVRLSSTGPQNDNVRARRAPGNVGPTVPARIRVVLIRRVRSKAVRSKGLRSRTAGPAPTGTANGGFSFGGGFGGGQGAARSAGSAASAAPVDAGDCLWLKSHIFSQRLAIPRKAKKPTTSVIVVTSGPDATAGSTSK